MLLEPPTMIGLGTCHWRVTYLTGLGSKSSANELILRILTRIFVAFGFVVKPSLIHQFWQRQNCVIVGEICLFLLSSEATVFLFHSLFLNNRKASNWSPILRCVHKSTMLIHWPLSLCCKTKLLVLMRPRLKMVRSSVLKSTEEIKTLGNRTDGIVQWPHSYEDHLVKLW